jgi:acetyltransferase
MEVRRINADVDIMITGAHQENPRLAIDAAAIAIPSAWPQNTRTRDGVDYRIRPIKADDRERDRAFIAGLSTQSRYSRMMGLVREPSAELLDRLVRVDYRREMALVAVVGEDADEAIIAVARYGGNPAYCEFAVVVADEWQGRGIGTHLSKLLFDYAKANGVRRMFAILLADNSRMLKLADDLRMSVRRSSDDNSVVEAWRTL